MFPDTDLRVLLPEGDEFATLADKFSSAGAQACQVRYLLEDEAIIADGQRREVVSRVCRLNSSTAGRTPKSAPEAPCAPPGPQSQYWRASTQRTPETHLPSVRLAATE